ncbi:MAG: gamma-glutamylcyclotransferase [Deltaproteobacteria bacterium]|nr:gamma-glutamylcyclotransferase [Deltaproteobacteria bacterium]
MARRGYPYILPHSGSKVEGLLIRNLDPESLRRLDCYEDEGRLFSAKGSPSFAAGDGSPAKPM